MKYFALATVAAVAFAAVPAQAAPIVTLENGGVVVLQGAGPGAVSGDVDFTVDGNAPGTPGEFTATFTFTNPFSPGNANASVSFNYDPDLVTFTGGNFSGGGVFVPGLSVNGSSIQIDRFSLPGGPQTLTITGRLNDPISGNGNNFAAIGGTLTLTAVPEPTTWALFILGFGAIGHSMRRRSSKVRVAKASLNFA